MAPSRTAKKQFGELFRLRQFPATQRKIKISRAHPDLIECLTECAHNILYKRIGISTKDREKLRRHKAKLRLLAERKASVASRRRVLQSGGFLGSLLGVIVPLLGSLLGIGSK